MATFNASDKKLVDFLMLHFQQQLKKKQKPQKKMSKAAKKDIKEEKNFTALVEKYKSKLNSASGIATKQKWFDT